MNRHLETPKPWGASKQRAHGKAPWDGFLGCGILEKLERQHKRDPSPAGSCCWHPPAEQQEEQGREHCQRAREDKQWDKAKRELDWEANTPLSAGTRKPDVPIRASLAKSGHVQNAKEIIAAAPPAPAPARKPHGGKPGCIPRGWNRLSQQMGLLVVSY